MWLAPEKLTPRSAKSVPSVYSTLADMDMASIELRHVMTPNVETGAARPRVEEAAALMRSLDVGAIPACDGDRLVGMLTDRDITVRETAEGSSPKRSHREPPEGAGGDRFTGRPGRRFR